MRRVRVVLRFIGAMSAAIAVLVTVAGLAGVGATTVRNATAYKGLPDVELRPLAQRSRMVAADGSVIATLYEEDREPVPLQSIPPLVRKAVIAVEDRAFYEHNGVSVRGLLRAMKRNTTAGGMAQGGSTITQQLVKNSILTSERSYDRKAKEAVLAFRMEKKLSKQQILERYLNTVYFGQGAYGVASAAQRYFGKPLDQVTSAEAALLAGLIASPDSYDPIRRPDASKARRAHALARMRTEGIITPEQEAADAQTPLPTTINRIDAQPDDYFAEEVRRQLLADKRLGETPQDRSAMVFKGGITVETTLDPALQAAAEQAVAGNLPPSEFTASLVTIDPATGDVKALVGGPNFGEAKYNLATQGRRQAGSSMKTVALAAWIADGRSPEDLVDATAPCSFPIDGPEGVWNVDNYDGGSGQVLITSLREATVKSSNCAYARVSLALGPQKIVEMAKKLGMSQPLPEYPSVVLGTGEVSPLEMATMYATLAADGVRRPPVFIKRVVGPDGGVILENKPGEEQVLEPQVARTVTDVLRGVVDRGTGQRAKLGRPVAGKTGTAQEWRDAWFAGFTPQLATAVWMGHPKGQISMKGVGGVNVTGGSFPAQIWKAFMEPATGLLPVVDFGLPDPAAWPPPTWVGAPPAALPPGFVFPPNFVHPPDAPYLVALGLAPPPPPATAPLPGEPVPGPVPGTPPPGQATTTTSTSTTTTSTTSTTQPKKGRSGG